MTTYLLYTSWVLLELTEWFLQIAIVEFDLQFQRHEENYKFNPTYVF
jgi:hypothetical protein